MADQKGEGSKGKEKLRSATPITDELRALTVGEFCGLYDISRAFFYKLAPEQRPDLLKVGKRTLITREAAAEWARRMTVAASSSARAA